MPGLWSKLSRRRLLWGGGLIIAAVSAAYFPTLRAGFVWDDDSVLTANPLIKASDGLSRFWCTAEATDYWPMSSTSLWFEWRLWGLHPLGYHATNLALHAGACLLLWLVLARLTVRGAFLASLLFAVHPVNVESVAWIAERKNLLAMVFFLLAVFFFLRTDLWLSQENRPGLQLGPPRDPVKPRASSLWYSLSLFAFTLGMLSKGSVAMLPVLLLGAIALRRRLLHRDLAWLAPFFVVAGAFAAVDVWFQKHYLAETIRQAGFRDRLAGAGAVVWFYFSKAIWPFDLIFVYPRWRIQAVAWEAWLPALAAIGLMAMLWRYSRPALRAWCYFCIMLVPVLGLTDVYFMKYSLVADHYQHLAIIGVVGLAGAGWERWREAADRRPPALPYLAGTAVVLILCVLTWRQCEVFRDGETLYRAILRRNPAATLAYNNLGNILLNTGRVSEAISDFQAALHRNPDDVDAHNNLGDALVRAGRFSEAIDQLDIAARLDPRAGEAHYNLGNALAQIGRVAEAEGEYETALRINPRDVDAHNNLGILLLGERRTDAAIAQLQAALRLYPDSPATHDNLGNAFIEAGRFPEAAAEYEAAVKLKPDYPEARNNLGSLLLQAGRASEAEEQFETVLRTNPQSAEARTNLGDAFVQQGLLSEAIEQYLAAVRANPSYGQAHNNLGVALSRAGRLEEAIPEFEAALRLDPNLADAARNLRRAQALLRRMGR